MKVRMYCQVDAEGKLKNIVFGEGVAVLDDFPFFFFIDREKSEYVAENMERFKVSILNFETELVEMEVAPNE